MTQLPNGVLHMKLDQKEVADSAEIEELVRTLNRLYTESGRLRIMIEGMRISKTTKKDRDYIQREIRDKIEALAVVSNKKLVKALVLFLNLFLPASTVIQFCHTEQEALNWLNSIPQTT